jgi:NAD(P)-dependent dehydrogenase (short-subunit alcohol dehydrogenase family)
LAVTLRDADVVIDVVNTLDEVAGVYGVADGVVILDALSDDPGDLVIGVFAAVKDALRLSARWIVSVAAAGSQISAGLSGLMRTVARENPDVGVRHVEVTGDIVTDDVARIVSRELRVDSRSPVVSYRAGVRFRSELRLSPLDRALDADSTDATQFTRLVEAAGLDRDSIVLLVGGARGITAELTKALADAVGCQLELVGRTALSTLADWPDLVGISDLSTIRAALVARGGATVGELTREASRLAAANQVQATLDYAAAAGSPARYHQVDVGSPYETGELIKDIYAEFGRIDAVVNAVASFSRVWDAKVGGATNVLGALSANAVKPSFVVQYGSISGLYGTRGQADYAGANCALEQLGASWSDAHGVRCLTAHWGPWATLSDGSGMVSPELQQQYDRLGVEVINPRAGVTTLLRELAYGNPALTTVTFTPGLW